ncbi:hypothetical protein FDECE_12947 [Fusarium decemcellulare]|nr:hypothetical protein FDECE_12947 [Fusarium decemcellulare]
MDIFPPASLNVGTGSPVDELGEEIRRRFVPSYSPMHRGVPDDDLVVYTPAKRVSQLQVLHPRTHVIELDKKTVVIHIDGACRGNGTPSARAAWGVYFGPDSPLNASGLLDSNLPQTSTRAEIEALSQALKILQRDVIQDFSLHQIRIVSDSDYLVRAMSQWIERWIEKGGRNAQGKPVAHYETIKEIHDLLDELTYGDDGGLDFKFWLVSRDQNQEADSLANIALDGRV